MVIKILLIIIYAILSMPIIQGFYPKSFLREQEIVSSNANSKRMDDLLIFACIILVGFVSIGISLAFFLYEREAWYCYFAPAGVPIFMQIWYNYYSLKSKFFLISLPIYLILLLGAIIMPIRDYIIVPVATEFQEEVIVKNVQQDSNGFQIYTAEYANGQFEVVIVNQYSYKCIPCQHNNKISGSVRERYKSAEIIELGIVLDNETPYAKYGILKRPNFFGRPIIDSYLLLNMVEEEIELLEFKEELPEFAR